MKEIYLTAEEENNEINYRVAYSFLKELHKIEGAGVNIIVHLQSNGGEFESGITIYDAIKYSPSSIYVICHGCVSSMATIILQAAKKRYLMPGCFMMIHFGDNMFDGSFKGLKAYSLYADNANDRMLNLYAERCIKGPFFKERGYTHEKVIDFISKKMTEKGDWYLSPEEACYYGFADKIISKYEYCNMRKKNV